MRPEGIAKSKSDLEARKLSNGQGLLHGTSDSQRAAAYEALRKMRWPKAGADIAKQSLQLPICCREFTAVAHGEMHARSGIPHPLRQCG